MSKERSCERSLFCGMFPCHSSAKNDPGLLLVRLLAVDAANGHADVVDGERDDSDDTRDCREEFPHHFLPSRVQKHPQLWSPPKQCAPMSHCLHCSGTSAFGAGVLSRSRSTGL